MKKHMELFIVTVCLPYSASNESAQLLAASVHPAKELLLAFPRLPSSLDVLLEGGCVEVGRTAVIYEVHHRIILSLSLDASQLVGDGFKSCKVFSQPLLSLVLSAPVALLHALSVTVADSPHTYAVLVGCELIALKFLDRSYECIACLHSSLLCTLYLVTWSLIIVVFRYFYMCIPVIDVYFHAHHDGTETIGEGRKHGELSHGG